MVIPVRVSVVSSSAVGLTRGGTVRRAPASSSATGLECVKRIRSGMGTRALVSVSTRALQEATYQILASA